MEKYISYQKLSEKKKRELNQQQRGTWGVTNPVTRKTENGKGYSRKKARQWKDDVPLTELFLYPLPN